MNILTLIVLVSVGLASDYSERNDGARASMEPAAPAVVERHPLLRFIIGPILGPMPWNPPAP